jgi:hypothetical protein
MANGTEGSSVTKLESRWIAFVTAVALLLGGWWLQNQYDTMLRIQQQLADFQRHVDDGYVRKDYLATVEARLGRIEDKLDALRDEKRTAPLSGR